MRPIVLFASAAVAACAALEAASQPVLGRKEGAEAIATKRNAQDAESEEDEEQT
jgi:hypothetical protein